MNAKQIKAFMKRVTARYANNSPFAAMREDEIEQRIRANQVFLYNSEGDLWNGSNGDFVGLAIARLLDRKLTLRDFAQRHFTFDPGMIYISHFLFDHRQELPARFPDESRLDLLLGPIRDRFTSVRIAVEFYPEDVAVKLAIHSAGWWKIMTKVSAFAEIKNVYSNDSGPLQGLSYDPAENANLLVIKENFLHAEDRRFILGELADALTIGATFANHYSIYNKDDKWSGMSIRGYKRDDPGFIEKPTEMSKAWKLEHPDLLNLHVKDTNIRYCFGFLMHCLHTRLSTELERVRILRLEPHGEILRHCDIQDKDAGLADGKIARFHVPLKTNNTTFRSWNTDGICDTLQMPLDSLCYLDHRKPHAVINDGDADRLHLIVDVYSNETIRDLVRSSYAKRRQI